MNPNILSPLILASPRSHRLQQGGVFVFDGRELLFSHYDPSTGAHADLEDVIRAALVR